MSELGDRLRRLRQEARLSQVELAGAELSASYVSLIESGRRQPSPDVIAQLARRLGCAPSRLAEGRPSSRQRELELELALAELELLSGSAGAARGRLTRLVAESDDDLHGGAVDTARLLLAQVHLSLAEPAEAIRLLMVLAGRAREGGSGQPPLLVAERLARAYLDAGDCAMALATAQGGLGTAVADALDPSPELAGLLGTAIEAALALGGGPAGAAQGSGTGLAARRLLDVVAALASTDLAVLYLGAAHVAVGQDRPEEALTLSRLGVAAQRDPGSVRTELERLRRVALEALLAGTSSGGDRRTAEEVLLLVGTGEPGLDAVRAQALLALGRHDEAVASALQAAGQAGQPAADSADAHRILGDAYLALGHRSEAHDAFARAAELLAGTSASRAAVGVAAVVASRLAAVGDSEAAAGLFRMALDRIGITVPATPRLPTPVTHSASPGAGKPQAPASATSGR